MTMTRKNTSEFARILAAKCWADPRTERVVFDSILGEVVAEQFDIYIKALHDAVSAARWMSGASDFGPGEKGHDGWIKVRGQLNDIAANLLPTPSLAVTAPSKEDTP